MRDIVAVSKLCAEKNSTIPGGRFWRFAMRMKLFHWLDKEFAALSCEGKPTTSAGEEMREVLERFDATLRGLNLSLENTVRTRLWARDKDSRRLASTERLKVLSGKAIENIQNSKMDEMVVTDTIPLSEEAAACTRIRLVSVAGLLAETIRRVHSEESVSSLYMD